MTEQVDVAALVEDEFQRTREVGDHMHDVVRLQRAFRSFMKGRAQRRERSEDDSSVVGGKRKAAKKKGKADKKQQPRQKSQPRKSKKSKPGHLNPQGAQGSSPRGAANQSVSSQKKTPGSKRKRPSHLGSSSKKDKKKSKRGGGRGDSN